MVSVSGSGNRIEVRGSLILDTAKTVLNEGLSALDSLPAGKDAVFDLSELDVADSAALSVVFSWMRYAQAENRSIRIANPPAQLLSLASVYGVSDMLPLA